MDLREAQDPLDLQDNVEKGVNLDQMEHQVNLEPEGLLAHKVHKESLEREVEMEKMETRETLDFKA